MLHVLTQGIGALARPEGSKYTNSTYLWGLKSVKQYQVWAVWSPREILNVGFRVQVLGVRSLRIPRGLNPVSDV